MNKSIILSIFFILFSACRQTPEIKVGDCIQSKQFEGLSSKYVPTYKVLEVGTHLVVYQMCGNTGKTSSVEIERKERVQSDYNVVTCPGLPSKVLSEKVGGWFSNIPLIFLILMVVFLSILCFL